MMRFTEQEIRREVRSQWRDEQDVRLPVHLWVNFDDKQCDIWMDEAKKIEQEKGKTA